MLTNGEKFVSEVNLEYNFEKHSIHERRFLGFKEICKSLPHKKIT